MRRSSKWSVTFKFINQTPACTSLIPRCTTWLTHLILLALITRIIFGEEYISLSSSLLK